MHLNYSFLAYKRLYEILFDKNNQNSSHLLSILCIKFSHIFIIKCVLIVIFCILLCKNIINLKCYWLNVLLIEHKMC